MVNSPRTIESRIENGGVRSVTRVTVAPGATALLHYHTDYAETFCVVQGELTVVFKGHDQRVVAGEFSDTIQQGKKHTFKNTSTENVEVDIIMEPGHAGSERANDIVAGLQRDKRMNEFSSWGGYNLLSLALFDITNTIPVGISRLLFTLIRLWYGSARIAKTKADLLSSYRGLTINEYREASFNKAVALLKVSRP